MDKSNMKICFLSISNLSELNLSELKNVLICLNLGSVFLNMNMIIIAVRVLAFWWSFYFLPIQRWSRVSFEILHVHFVPSHCFLFLSLGNVVGPSHDLIFFSLEPVFELHADFKDHMKKINAILPESILDNMTWVILQGCPSSLTYAGVRTYQDWDKGLCKVYFITWPVQNVTGQQHFLSLYTTGSTLFIKQIWTGLNRAVTFYELKIGWTFEYKMSHLEDKIVNHASREMHTKMCLSKAKYPC